MHESCALSFHQPIMLMRLPTINDNRHNLVSLRLMSWNIKGHMETLDGLKTNKLQEIHVIDSFSKYDIVVLQETHRDKEKAKEIVFPGFAPGVHYCRPKRAKAPSPSGGISVFVKEELRPCVKFQADRSDSDIVWIQIPASSPAQDTYLGCVYIPPESSSFGKDNTSKIWDRLETDLEHFSVKGNIILCGDLNARTGTLEDFITMDTERNPYELPNSYQFDTVYKRNSMDGLIQKNGRKCINACVDNNMCILNGRMLGDLRGKFTCFSEKGSSVVDYFMCSQNLLRQITKMIVRDLGPYSDHCPLELSIHLSVRSPKQNAPRQQQTLRETPQTVDSKQEKVIFLWDDNSALQIDQAFHTDCYQKRLHEINANLTQTLNRHGTHTNREEIETHLEE